MSAFDIHDYDVGADLLDIPVWNTDIGFCAEQIKEFIAAGNKDLADLAAALVKLQVGNPAKLLTVPHIDHVFGLQFRKEHNRHPFFFPVSLLYV